MNPVGKAHEARMIYWRKAFCLRPRPVSQKKQELHGHVNGNPEIDFALERLASCGGLELSMRDPRRIGWNGQLRRHRFLSAQMAAGEGLDGKRSRV